MKKHYPGEETTQQRKYNSAQVRKYYPGDETLPSRENTAQERRLHRLGKTTQARRLCPDEEAVPTQQRRLCPDEETLPRRGAFAEMRKHYAGEETLCSRGNTTHERNL